MKIPELFAAQVVPADGVLSALEIKPDTKYILHVKTRAPLDLVQRMQAFMEEKGFGQVLLFVDPNEMVLFEIKEKKAPLTDQQINELEPQDD